MKKNGMLAKILAVAGTGLVWIPVLAPVLISAAIVVQGRIFRFDYLMPAELFPVALAGGGLLFWAALRAQAHRRLIGGSLGVALGSLAGGQALAVVSGLASGAAQPPGGGWALVLASIAVYSLALVVMGLGGVWLLRDLFKRPDRQPLVQALLAHFDSVFEGPNGDYPAVLESLAGISAAQALWKPAPNQNSIWQIVEHLIASKEWQIEWLAHGQAASPVWGEPAGGEAEWQASLARLKDAHRRLKLALAQVAEADLLKVPSGENHTLLELLLSSGPAHEAHHGGQIDYLKSH